MDKLESRFNKIVLDNDRLVNFVFSELQHVILPEKYENLIMECTKETKKIAIEFAKKLMETKITALRGMNDVPEVRNSPDYALMKGELMLNGDKLFEQFIEEYYE